MTAMNQDDQADDVTSPCTGVAVIGMVGRFDFQKGLDLLAAAIPSLVNRGARFVVLGSVDPTLGVAFRALGPLHSLA